MMRFTTVLVLFLLLGSLALAQPTIACPDDSDTLRSYEIQGSERRSIYTGETVSLEAVVTATFLADDALGGFFVQDPLGDGKAATSDGLFIRLPRSGPLKDTAIAAGDIVRVSGKVLERGEQTQLDRLSELSVCGYYGLITPTDVQLDMASATDWERYEGMLIRFPEVLTVTETYNLGRYGEVSLSAGGRLYQPNNGQDATDNAARRLLLNDGSTVENPDIIPYLQADLTLRLGDTVSDLTAVVVNYGLNAYRLEPAIAPRFERANPRLSQPSDVGGSLKVAGFNVLNFFSSLQARGADSREEFLRQQEKIVSALAAINADVFGLIEVENNGEKAIGQLTKALNTAVGAENYTFVPDPDSGTGSDQIKQALIYKPGKLELLAVSSDPAAIHDRPPVAATFRQLDSGEIFTVVVAHFKSKGGCPPTGDTDEGQGCWNLRRGAQAQALADFVTKLQERSGDPDVLIVGDLNSYRLENPVKLLENEGFVNLDNRLPLDERYTYVFFGESGTLDYALASSELDPQVSGFTIWHINSDEPRVLDYNTEYNPAYVYRPYPFRSSDHDPVIVGLDLE